jgi:hypothetical protein
MESSLGIDVLRGAQPTRRASASRRGAASHGITDELGRWLHDGMTVVVFDSPVDARTWLADPRRPYVDELNFQYVDVCAAGVESK